MNARPGQTTAGDDALLDPVDFEWHVAGAVLALDQSAGRSGTETQHRR